jgi:thiol-disulfide isomerase/thioredoxin
MFPKKLKFILVLLFIFFHSFLSAQSTWASKEVKSDDSLSYSPFMGSIEPLQVIKKWKNGKDEVDSILWSTPLQPNLILLRNFYSGLIDSVKVKKTLAAYRIDSSTLKCISSDTSLQILSYKQARTLHLQMLERYNKFLNRDYEIVYDLDTMERDKNVKLPNQKIKTISITYHHCVDNKPVPTTVNVALIPFKGAVNYMDEDLNNNYVIVSKNKSRVFNMQSAKIFVFQQRIAPQFERPNVRIKVLENNEIHTDQIKDGIRYKNLYILGDTIFLTHSSFIVDSIALNGNTAFFKQDFQHQTSIATILPSKFLRQLKSFSTLNYNYLVLDFWGTWCAPCIKALPKLKKLESSLSKGAALISVLYDRKENEKLAFKIFQTNGAKWKQIFNDMLDSSNNLITNYMNISVFPTYMLIKKNGQIIFQDSGEEGLYHLLNLLKKLELVK